MKRILLAITLLALLGCKETKKETTQSDQAATVEDMESKQESNFKINPISHATMVLEWDGKTIFVDPVGGAEEFRGYDKPDMILVTDIHGDHLNVKTLAGLDRSQAKMIVPQAVADKMPDSLKTGAIIMANGASEKLTGLYYHGNTDVQFERGSA